MDAVAALVALRQCRAGGERSPPSGIVTICLTSMLAHSTLFGEPNLPNNVGVPEDRRRNGCSGHPSAPWFGLLFWATGAFSLFGSAMGITDYTSRLTADVLKSTYLP